LHFGAALFICFFVSSLTGIVVLSFCRFVILLIAKEAKGQRIMIGAAKIRLGRNFLKWLSRMEFATYNFKSGYREWKWPHKLLKVAIADGNGRIKN
jgi:hypothetical protein